MSNNTEASFEKKFTWLSLFGIAFSLTCSWVGISSTLAAGLSNGGPALIIYGLIVVLFFNLMCAVSLGQFAYLMPNSCGVSYWTYELMNSYLFKQYHNPINIENSHSKLAGNDVASVKSSTIQKKFQVSTAMFVAMLNYFGAIFTSASICSSLAMSCIGIYGLLHENYNLKRWHIFVAYQCINTTLSLFNLWSGPLPTIGKIGLYVSLVSFFLTFVISLVSRSNYSGTPWISSHYIFRQFENTNGWNSKGIAFIVGLINPMWGFVGIDSASHMVDEIGHFQSRKLVPKVMKLTVLVGFTTGFVYAIGMFFCITDKNAVISGLFPIIEIYYQACRNKKLAVLLQSFCITTGYICGIACGTWQCRILWATARMFEDSYAPNSFHYNAMKKFAVLNENFKSPLISHFVSQFAVLVIGCIFIVSDTAFNAIITSCITLLMLSYAIPSLIFVFFTDRKLFIDSIIQEEGLDQSKAPSFSIIPHVCCAAWAIFCLVFLSLPYSLPVAASNMNYVSTVYAVVFILIAMNILPLWT